MLHTLWRPMRPHTRAGRPPDPNPNFRSTLRREQGPLRFRGHMLENRWGGCGQLRGEVSPSLWRGWFLLGHGLGFESRLHLPETNRRKQ
jgi:hypothetical protein